MRLPAPAIVSLIRKFYTFMPCTPERDSDRTCRGNGNISRKWKQMRLNTLFMAARRAVKEDDGRISRWFFNIYHFDCAFTYFYIINLNMSEWIFIFIFITLSKLIENNSQPEQDALPFWRCRLQRWLILKAAFRTNGILFSSIFQHSKCLFTSNYSKNELLICQSYFTILNRHNVCLVQSRFDESILSWNMNRRSERMASKHLHCHSIFST